MPDETTVSTITRKLREHIDAPITGAFVTTAHLTRRDETHSVGIRYGDVRLLLDALAAATARAEQAEQQIAQIEAACYLAFPDNSPAVMGDDAYGDMGRFVCADDNGDPFIDVDTPAEVVAELSRCWTATCEALEKSQQRVAELEGALQKETAIRRTAESILHDFTGAPCLKALLGEDPEGCLCFGCQCRAYFRVMGRKDEMFATIDAARAQETPTTPGDTNG